MLELPELQAAFAAALDDEDAGALASLVRANGLDPARRVAVYRNNTRLTQLEALAGIYPAVQRLLGEEFFAQMAELFAALYPSRCGDLRRYGPELAEFLEAFPATASFAYLPDVARLEWAWHEAFHAPFAEALDAQALAQLAEEERASLGLELHPGVRLLRSAWPAAKIWEFALGEHGADAPRLELGGGAMSQVLVARPQLEVLVVDLEPVEWDWLQTLASGGALGAADARAAGAGADPAGYLRKHLELRSLRLRPG